MHFVSPFQREGAKERGAWSIYQNLSVVICGRLKHTVLSFSPTEIAESRRKISLSNRSEEISAEFYLHLI